MIPQCLRITELIDKSACFTCLSPMKKVIDRHTHIHIHAVSLHWSPATGKWSLASTGGLLFPHRQGPLVIRSFTLPLTLSLLPVAPFIRAEQNLLLRIFAEFSLDVMHEQVVPSHHTHRSASHMFTRQIIPQSPRKTNKELAKDGGL